MFDIYFFFFLIFSIFTIYTKQGIVSKCGDNDINHTIINNGYLLKINFFSYIAWLELSYIIVFILFIV